MVKFPQDGPKFYNEENDDMPVFSQPTQLFVGNMNSDEKKFIKKVLINASKKGYNKFIEPCSGELSMSYLATGLFNLIEASDVTLFSSVLGYYASGKDCSELEVKVNGESVNDPVEILYDVIYYRALKNQSGSYYGNNIIRDLEERKDFHKEKIKAKLDEAKNSFKVMNYRPMDLFDHLREVYDDENAICILNLPTYKGGYEKFFDTGGAITWKEPKYEIFDPDKDIQKLKDFLINAKCLVIFYEEKLAGETIFEPVFARTGAKSGENAYFTVNNKAKYDELFKNIAIPRKEQKLEKLKYPLLPVDFEPSPDDKIEVIEASTDTCNYYRSLLTHNFTGSSNGSGYAVIINGMMAGVFGFSKAFATFFAKSDGNVNDIFLVFGMNSPLKNYRLGRLITMLACQKEIIWRMCNDVEKMTFFNVATTMITKYPESKQMRGLMKLIGKKFDEKTRLYRLVYRTEIQDKKIQEVYKEWIMKEKKYKELKK